MWKWSEWRHVSKSRMYEICGKIVAPGPVTSHLCTHTTFIKLQMHGVCPMSFQQKTNIFVMMSIWLIIPMKNHMQHSLHKPNINGTFVINIREFISNQYNWVMIRHYVPFAVKKLPKTNRSSQKLNLNNQIRWTLLRKHCIQSAHFMVTNVDVVFIN